MPLSKLKLTTFKIAIFHQNYVNIYFLLHVPLIIFGQNQMARVFIGIRYKFT